MKGDSLQTFKNIKSPTRDNLGEVLAVFGRNYVKPQSMAHTVITNDLGQPAVLVGCECATATDTTIRVHVLDDLT